MRALCIASGGSLSEFNASLYYGCYDIVIAVNCAWEAAPWCDVIYAGDFKWWEAYHDEIYTDCVRVCANDNARIFGCENHKTDTSFNSGANAIRYAVKIGATDIDLIGYDCSLKNGIHFHGKHERVDNPDENSVKRWSRQFAIVASECKNAGVRVTNRSSYTDLECFDRA